ncbi:unnamed protein product [Nippostrongylus brasiliensis]|uniref:Transposase n=1 Tax=Nippostrongylus brasiliensis TaxID=27835 RepID=A0A0N4YFD7_NIPBR|nr:unnamed protein product [Nippostrongylus brasiliensis]
MDAVQQDREKTFRYLSIGIHLLSELQLYYTILRHIALSVNREYSFVDGLKASKDWVWNTIKGCGLRSRKVMYFKSTRNLRSCQVVNTQRMLLWLKGGNGKVSSFCDIDQCGITREVVSKRTLTPMGVKQVHLVVQRVASLSHSYAVVPVLYADGVCYRNQ